MYVCAFGLYGDPVGSLLIQTLLQPVQVIILVIGIFMLSFSPLPVLSLSHCVCFWLVLDNSSQDENFKPNSDSCKVDESKLPLQLAIVGRPNVGKSTLLNILLQEDRVLVGPEAGLTRDSVRAEFQYQGRTVYLVQDKLLVLTLYLVT